MQDIEILVKIISAFINVIGMISLLIAIINRTETFLPSAIFISTLMFSYTLQLLLSFILIFQWPLASYTCAVASGLYIAFLLIHQSTLLVCSIDHFFVARGKNYINGRTVYKNTIIIALLSGTIITGSLISHCFFSHDGLVKVNDGKYACLSAVMKRFPFVNTLSVCSYSITYFTVFLVWIFLFVRYLWLRRSTDIFTLEERYMWFCEKALKSLTLLIWPWFLIDITLLLVILMKQYHILTILVYADYVKAVLYPLTYLFCNYPLRSSFLNLIVSKEINGEDNNCKL